MVIYAKGSSYFRDGAVVYTWRQKAVAIQIWNWHFRSARYRLYGVNIRRRGPNG